MTIDTEQQQIEQFITDQELAEIVPTLIFVQNRAHSRLWRVTLLTAGDLPTADQRTDTQSAHS